MTIQIGASIPSATLRQLTEHGPQEIDAPSFFAGRKVVLFAVVGAFTGTCNNQLPTFLASHDALRAKGVDEIACVAVNDPAVLAAWSEATGADGKITMLADGNAEFAAAMGMAIDASAFGLGPRSRRYAMVVEDGKVTALEVEENPGVCTITDGAKILESLS
ncbi:MAG: redoxin family protein [Planctomycetota bacterium]|jgi:peroxiredoxin